MPIIQLPISYDVRSQNKKIHNFFVGANVSSNGFGEDKSKSLLTRSDKSQINIPDWTHQPNTGVSTYFKRHNGFKDQERYNRMSRNFTIRQGTFVKYYSTSYNPDGDPLYREDNNREIERYFDVPVMLTFQPENEIYNRFGIQHLDEFEMHVHMTLFMELQYANLKKHSVQPACNPLEHNPIWSQRGYEDFKYYGYTAAQIMPKSGDYIKIEAFDTLFEIESVKDAAPEYQHRWRKYWWKLFLKSAMDTGRSVSNEILNDPEQNAFINDIMGVQTGNVLDKMGNQVTWPFDVSKTVDTLKKDVLFRPPEVPKSAPDITADPNFYSCPTKFAKW